MTLRTLLRNTVAVPPMAVVLRSSQAPAGVSIMPKPTVLQDREFDDRFYNLWGSYPRTIGASFYSMRWSGGAGLIFNQELPSAAASTLWRWPGSPGDSRSRIS